jgi:hypothetical protein
MLARVLGIHISTEEPPANRLDFLPAPGGEGGIVIPEFGEPYVFTNLYMDPHRLLHEVMHILCDPPDELTEDGEYNGLLQVERAYGKAILGRGDYKRLLQSQGTVVMPDGRELAAWGGKELNEDWWLDGLRHAKLCGLLLEDGAPSFERAEDYLGDKSHGGLPPWTDE